MVIETWNGWVCQWNGSDMIVVGRKSLFVYSVGAMVHCFINLLSSIYSHRLTLLNASAWIGMGMAGNVISKVPSVWLKLLNVDREFQR